MSKSIILLASTIVAIATILTLSFADRSGHETLGGGQPPRGPDVVSWCAGGWGTQADMTLYGQEDGVNGYAFGTTSCNWGDMVADWYSGTNRVPVIAQTCYRVKDGRFEQIGTAWLKHSFCAVSEPGCGTCQATSCDTLGIGCADTYWAGLNANAIAPRSAINAFTGYYDYPFSIVPTGPSSMQGKLQIKTVDISPSLNEEAIYFIEAQYVSPDDAEWNNQDNNASYKWIKFINETTPLGLSSTQVTQPAIYGWKFFDHEVDVQQVRVPKEGLLHMGTRVYDNGDGTWDYVYALHNLNSDRSIGSFSIPLGECVEVSNLGFNDVDYHSGEILDDTDWEPTITATELRWESEAYEVNEWANAIRWGTTFTFWFTANQGPSSSELGLGLFKPGEISEFTHTSVGPICPADCEGDVNENGMVDVNDLLVLVAAWGTDDPQSDINNDGIVNISDILILMADWGCA